MSELSSRITAMDNATTNAGVLIDEITLEMNKTQQSAITRIAEITGTNEVLSNVSRENFSGFGQVIDINSLRKCLFPML